MDKGLEFGAGAGTQDSQNDNLSENGGQKEFPSSANEHRSPQNSVMERHGTKKRAEEKTKDPWTVQGVLQICFCYGCDFGLEQWCSGFGLDLDDLPDWLRLSITYCSALALILFVILLVVYMNSLDDL